MKTVNIHQAKTHFSRLVEQAAGGEEILIARSGKPIARLGRLDLGEPPEKCLPREIERSRFRPLPITVEHALEVAALPHHHTDPFDRLLIAQARREGMKMVTSDPAFEAYGISILSARA